MKQFTYTSYSKASCIEEVKNQMAQLDTELCNTDMEKLLAFNHTYFIITQNVYNKLDTGYFENDDLMKKIDTCFGNYYFEALYKYINKKSCPPAWQLLFEACRRQDTFQFVYMALGVNAHVNNDLPQTLHDAMKGNIYQNDYTRINDIIRESIPEVMDSLQETNTLLRLSEHMAKPIYASFLQKTIVKWRDSAWQQYICLNNEEIKITTIENAAKEKATILASIQHVTHIPNILKVC